jgi:hypothetical protein
MEYAIPIDPVVFRTYYPTVTSTVVATTPKAKYKVVLQDPGGSLRGELDKWATELKNENPNYTTCCIQMSHAINMSFHLIDATKMVGLKSYWRTNHAEKIASAGNKEFRYLASVDEMKAFLNHTFGDGERISRRGDGKPASRAEAKSFIQGRPGIVVFMGNQTAGIHTEIWNGVDFHQGWMKQREDVFDLDPVWFWDTGVQRDLEPV